MRRSKRHAVHGLVALAVSLAFVRIAAAADGREALSASAPPLVPSARLQLLQATASPPAASPTAPEPNPRSKMYKAALLSALIPGLGEYYSGHHNRAIISGTVEAAIWTSYITFNAQEDLRRDRSIEYAYAFGGAGPNGDEDYFKAMGQFVRAEGPGQWNEFVRRRSRDTGEVVGIEYTGDQAWAWTSIERFIEYRQLRRDMLSAEEHAQTAIAFAVANRIVSIVSVVQAIRSDSRHEKEGGLGLQLEFDGHGATRGARLGLVNRF